MLLPVLLALAGCSSFPDGWLYVTDVAPTGATVVWTTKAWSTETVQCRDASGRTATASAGFGWRGLRRARLESLAPGAVHHCRVGPGRRKQRRSVRFRTPPVGEATFRFAAVGDTGDHSPAAVALAKRIRASRPDFLLHTGDLAYPRGTMWQLHRRFFRPYRQTLERVPFFPTPGNHDLTSRSAYDPVFLPAGAASELGNSYAFAWGGTQFVSVESPEVARPDSPTVPWMTDVLARMPPEPWRIVFLHEPPWGPGTKFVTPGLRSTLAPVLGAGNVDVLMAGHEHIYARSVPICPDGGTRPGMLALITGGGSADLGTATPQANFPVVLAETHFLRVTVRPQAIDVRAIGLDRRTIDRFTYRRGAEPCRSTGWPKLREREAD